MNPEIAGKAPKQRRHILQPYAVNGRTVRYSAILRGWIVERWGGPDDAFLGIAADEWRYFKTKSEAFRFAQQGGTQ